MLSSHALAYARATAPFLITTFAVEFKPDTRGAALFGHYPRSCRQWWVVTHVLRMTALEHGSPMAFIVSIKCCDSLFQNLLSD
jgi:hypothetical protein